MRCRVLCGMFLTEDDIRLPTNLRDGLVASPGRP